MGGRIAADFLAPDGDITLAASAASYRCRRSSICKLKRSFYFDNCSKRYLHHVNETVQNCTLLNCRSSRF
jgi:hypothetical protein